MAAAKAGFRGSHFHSPIVCLSCPGSTQSPTGSQRARASVLLHASTNVATPILQTAATDTSLLRWHASTGSLSLRTTL
jgi:hypothetical protein